MSKHINPSYLIKLPSGASIHPCRLIHKDGIFSWKDACRVPPLCLAHEAHIQKTAQRLEELNSWIRIDFEPWETLKVSAWYDPSVPELSEGISLYFTHRNLDSTETLEYIKPHILEHETLQLRGTNIYFQRC